LPVPTLLIENNLTFSLSVGEKVNYSKPSIDVLFQSASEVYTTHLIGIILTGTNNDGAQGIKLIKQRGGLTIAQDPGTAKYNIMPMSAINTHHVDYILPLKKIPKFLNSIIKKEVRDEKKQ
jgi:two-component system chemotaxis response regulator CheB